MDRLPQNQQRSINDALVSNNGLVNRIMQGDGNFVAYAPGGNIPVHAFWSTGTYGNPGAWVVLQDDGTLVVYDSANNPLWTSNTVQDLSSPTCEYSDANGYTYIETSEWWKQTCTSLPCLPWLTWPDHPPATPPPAGVGVPLARGLAAVDVDGLRPRAWAERERDARTLGSARPPSIGGGGTASTRGGSRVWRTPPPRGGRGGSGGRRRRSWPPFGGCGSGIPGGGR